MRQNTKNHDSIEFLKSTRQRMIPREKKPPILSMLCELAQREFDIPSEKITHEKAHYLTFSRIADF
jgi:hypothetical protein